MRRWAAGFLAAISLASAAPAIACSPVSDYRVPSNFELVHRADLIVLARVVFGPTGRGALAGRGVAIEPVRVLKGPAPSEPLRLEGRVGWNGQPLRALPTPLGAPHFSTLAGSCIRLDYPAGGLVVAMFVRTPEGLRQIGSPFARAVEDVEGEDGLWVRAVGEYLAAQRGVDEPGLRRAAETLRAALAARRDDLGAQAMALDLRDYLDRTDPAGPVMRGGSSWDWTGGTDGAGATIHGSAPGRNAGFRCTEGESALRVDLAHAEGAPQLALVIGDRRFEAEGEARQTMAGGLEIASGLIPFTPELDAMMRSSPAPAGIAVDGTNLLIAPPADMLQKLAVACAAVLSPSRR